MARLRTQSPDSATCQHSVPVEPSPGRTTRIRSEELFRDQREIEIEHQGRIYRLRVTQLNKLILTA